MPGILGIDLGTTNSVVAFLDGERPVVIPNAEGERLTPSVVAFTDAGIIAGRDALRQVAANPARTIRSVKRLMGSGGMVRLPGGDYTPQEISALILGKVAGDAAAYLGEKIEKAVITVPAYFNNSQREATREAGAKAGLDVVRIINEPTAAALAYGLHKEEIHTVLVWDLGGGTFDVSILELGEGVFEVRAVNGDTLLGGDDWDRAVACHLAGIIEVDAGFNPLAHEDSLPRLREIAEGAKKALSGAAVSGMTIRLHDLMGSGPWGEKVVSTRLTRELFEELTAPLLRRLVAPTLQALSDAGMRPEEIDRVILVGGATRMPAVRELADTMFGRSRVCRDSINPDEVVAVGAAIQGGIIAGDFRDVVLVDVTPLSLGIETEGGVFARVIDRNTPVPVSRDRIFTTAADDQASVCIHVLQGERDAVRENTSLGVFELVGIPPAPKGEPRIDVSFCLDVDGILTVSAVDLHTGTEQRIEITDIRKPDADVVDFPA